MWENETRPECCPVFEQLPHNINCFIPEVEHELMKLRNQHEKRFVNNYRIMQLALPKIRKTNTLYVPLCPCRFQRPITIIRLDQRDRTRTTQLCLPKVRKLLEMKEKVKNVFPPDRYINFNRLIRKSLFSVYSRLANAQPPPERIPIKKWDRAEWAQHTKKLKKLAKPKVPKRPPKIYREHKSLKQMKRFRFLAKPKKYPTMMAPAWELTLAMRKHIASDRLKNLATATMRDTSMLYQELPIPIPLSVLKHKATKRTKTLAEPPAYRTAQLANAELRENPFAISPNALKAKAKKRTKELAEHREYENTHIRENPYEISAAALKAKAKPRTIELAKPKSR